MKNFVLNGTIGLCIADALGVPVEFTSRNDLTQSPVEGMRSGQTHNQPKGTWSDDTSMVLCTLDSLAKGLDYNDIMSNFFKWLEYSEYTAHDEVFDVGIATRKAILNYAQGTPALQCGGTAELDNGNGSLMRILPIAFYFKYMNINIQSQPTEYFSTIHNLSALTHAHPRSIIACGIYISIAMEIINEQPLAAAIQMGIKKSTSFYSQQCLYDQELKHFKRLSDNDFAQLDVSNIKSSGYVVDTLEAAIWCLLNTSSYQECVLKAVNLGEDTDTVASVAGGLAGMHYGQQRMPQSWVSQIARYQYIVDICNTFTNKYSK